MLVKDLVDMNYGVMLYVFGYYKISRDDWDYC